MNSDLLQLSFELCPSFFDRIEVKTLTGPLEDIHIFILEPLHPILLRFAFEQNFSSFRPLADLQMVFVLVFACTLHWKFFLQFCQVSVPKTSICIFTKNDNWIGYFPIKTFPHILAGSPVSSCKLQPGFEMVFKGLTLVVPPCHPGQV